MYALQICAHAARLDTRMGFAGIVLDSDTSDATVGIQPGQHVHGAT